MALSGPRLDGAPVLSGGHQRPATHDAPLRPAAPNRGHGAGNLAADGTTLHYTHQNIAELWNVMTRPVTGNGLGLTVAEAEGQVHVIEAGMTLLADSEALYREWLRIVVLHKVLGVQVHDARLAAAMRTHGVGHILTLNVSDFHRFAGVTAVHPSSV